MPSRIRLALGLLAALLMLAVPVAAQAHTPRSGGTYLALGDSLAYGYHQALFQSEEPNVDPSTFDHGYVNDFGYVLGLFHPGLQIVNDGCPGGTTDSLINGSGVPGFCGPGGPLGSFFPYVWLHHPYNAPSQLQDALQVLHSTPDVQAITLDIGANDLLHFLRGTCGFPTSYTCTTAQIEGEIAHVAQNTGLILSQLRAAAPNTRIVLLGLYNPYPAVLPAPGGDTLLKGLNQAFASVAASVPNTGFANPEPFFNPASVTGGSETQDVPVICTLTGMCPGGTYSPTSPQADIHPTDLGYAVLGGLVALAYH